MSDGIYVHRHRCPTLAGRLAWPAGPNSDAYWFGELCPKCRPLRFTRYNRVLRRVMRVVARQEGPAVGGVHDSEFINWLAVRQFADGVLADARARLVARWLVSMPARKL